jgi:PEP-CTERM/exosortase A-associated glycosyltransferase
MRILHVLDHSIPIRTGYTMRTLQILRHQRALGWETFHLTGPKHSPGSPPTETVDGLSFFRTEAAEPPIPGLSELVQMKRFSRRIAEVVDETRPDVLHVHSPVLNALPALGVAAKRRIPLVYEVRALWEDAAVSKGKCSPNGPRYRLSRAMETYAMKRADAVVAICEGLRKEIIGRGIPESRVSVMPNAVALEDFRRESPPDPGLADRLGVSGRRVIGFIGSFEPYEGLSVLLDAVAILASTMPDLRLLLIGNGPEESNLRAQAQRLGILDHVIFAGHVPHAKIQAYYDLIDICVYPRLSMRLTELVTPLKPVEAMARGRIVVATDIGGHREMVEDGVTGHLFPAGDPDALARAVRQTFERSDSWTEMREAARRYVEQRRNWRVNAAQYGPIYERLIAAAAAK